MDKMSINTLDKMLYNKNNLEKFLTKGKIIKGEKGIEFEFIKNETIFDLNEKEDLLLNRDEEFLDDSELFSQSKNSIIKDEENLITKKKSSICFLIDSLFTKEMINNDCNWTYKKQKTNFKPKKKEKKKNSCIEKFHIDELNNLFNNIDKDNLFKSICSICLNIFEINEEISLINNCLHIFHLNCLNEWINPLKLNKKNCPYCKLDIKKEN